jgi:hypothetical protein
MVNHTEDFANWIQSWSTRLENAYNSGIDYEGWPRFLEALQHFEKNGYFTPGQIDYFLRRDPRLGHGKLKDYNTFKGYNRKLGSILPAPVDAIIHGKFVAWTTPYQNMPDLTKRLASQAPGWEYNPRTKSWQGKNPVVQQRLTDIFN